MYGRRKYRRINKEVHVPPSAVPTYICNHCTKIKNLTSKTITLTGIADNVQFLTCRICEDCGKLLQDWINK